MTQSDGFALANPDADRPVLKRVGWALLLGAVSWFIMEHWSRARTGTTFTLNLLPVLLALLAGALLNGHLRAASLVRWLSAFAVVAVPLGVLSALAMQPLALTRAILSNEPINLLIPAVGVAFATALSAWALRSLGSDVVVLARRAIGRPQRRMWIPMVLAAALVSAGTAFTYISLNGEAARKAESMVRRELGPDFETAIVQLAMQKSREGSQYRATVVAWNGEDVRVIPLTWREE